MVLPIWYGWRVEIEGAGNCKMNLRFECSAGPFARHGLPCSNSNRRCGLVYGCRPRSPFPTRPRTFLLSGLFEAGFFQQLLDFGARLPRARFARAHRPAHTRSRPRSPHSVSARRSPPCRTCPKRRDSSACNSRAPGWPRARARLRARNRDRPCRLAASKVNSIGPTDFSGSRASRTPARRSLRPPSEYPVTRPTPAS